MSTEDRKSYQKAYKKAYAKSNRQITVTVSNSIYRDFAKQAEIEDTKVSTLVRNMAVAYLQREALLPNKVETELNELKFLIRNIANNVNQVAHYSNRVQGMVDENNLLGELKKLEDTIYQHTQKQFKR